MKNYCSACFSLAELAALRAHQAAKCGSSHLSTPSSASKNLLLSSASSAVKKVLPGSFYNSLSSSTTAPLKPPFQWGYSQTNGPNVWPEHFQAGKGKQQSPIDICPKADWVQYDPTLKTSKLQMDYDNTSARQLLNNQYTFQVNFDDTVPNTLIGGPLKTPYSLFQFHVHWASEDDHGSEHAVDGKRYPAELHLVHYNREKYGNIFEALSYPDGLAVIGVFFTIGQRHNEIQKLVDLFPLINVPSQTMEFNNRLNIGDMIPQNTHEYFTYQGSLTSPPLTESVTWILFPNPIEISFWQLRAFRRLHGFNWRPIQPLNDRTVRSTFKFGEQLSAVTY